MYAPFLLSSNSIFLRLFIVIIKLNTKRICTLLNKIINGSILVIKLVQVKLNIGSGKFYRAGYTNIDFFESEIADKIMNATDLDFPSNSVDEISAFHIVEHFDCIEAIYALSEWFRVLKPGGLLIIETPDLERTFKTFLESDNEKKKELLSWIYGLNAPGMLHKCGFTYSLIKEILERVGFTNIRKEKQKTHKYAPGMRIVCQKPENEYEAYQILSEFRKRIWASAKNFIEGQDLWEDFEETLMKPISLLFLKFLKDKDVTALEKIFEFTIYCPTAVKIFFITFENSEICEKQKLRRSTRKYLEICDFLEEINFPGKLMKLWEDINKQPGKEKELFTEFILLASTSVRKLLTDEYSSVKQQISSIESHYKLNYFSHYVVQKAADRKFRLGIKHFANGNLIEAKKLFMESLQLTPDNFLISWNIARIYVKLGEYKKAEKFYQRALRTVQYKDLRKRLLSEIDTIKKKQEIIIFPIDEITLLL